MIMRSLYCGILILAVTFVGIASAFSQVILKEDFQDKAPVKSWTASGKYKINFIGLTTENALSGRKVFKLDVSFMENTKGYYYFKIPCKFMPSDNFRLKSRVLIGKESTGKFGLGLNAYYPSLRHSGCRELTKGYTFTNNWLNLDIEASGWLQRLKTRFCKKYAPLADAGNLSPYIDGIVFFLFGSQKGKRVVVYLDKIEVIGNSIPEQDWKKLRIQRWTPILKKQQKLLTEYQDTLNKYLKGNGISAFGTNCTKFISKVKQLQNRYGKKFILSNNDYKRIKRDISDLKSATTARFSEKALIYTLDNPMISAMITPNAPVPRQARLGGKNIKIVAAKGEFESFSILVKAMKKLNKLTVICDSLKSSSGKIISTSAVDLKSVKCWYQSGGSWHTFIQGGSRKLTPELLLNDDSLVKVDDQQKTNFIKLRLASGDKYWNVDDPTWNQKRGSGLLPVDKFPIRDAKKLLPLRLDVNQLKQFWGTIQVPQTAPPGIYTGTLKVLNENEVLTRIKLTLRVLPFRLPMPKTRYELKNDFISSIFYRSRYNPVFPLGTISSEFRSIKQLTAELKNMRDHNIYNPNCYQNFEDKDSLTKMLELRNAAGMKGLPIFFIGFITKPSWKTKTEELVQRIKAIKSFMGKFDVPEYYCFGIDEAHEERLLEQLDVWENIHKAGGKIFSTGTMRNLKYIGGKVDIQVLFGRPERLKLELWKEKNKKIKLLAYAWPQGGIENPVINRRGLGMTTWLANYDGIMTYAYMHSMGNGWNDFDHHKYREHNYVYPTVDGVVSTIALAGLREGIDDIRYATKLKQLIKQHKNGSKAQLAVMAQDYLNEITATGSLKLIRLEIINYILKLLN